MTQAIISFDTEMSPALHQQGASAAANFDSSILGRCAEGDFGIMFQMDRLDAHGLTGVFFVDPMPALVFGPDIIADIVRPIVGRGHEVQLHIHTEWLAFAKENPLGNAAGRNIGDFTFDEQRQLIAIARDLLIAAGAPDPIAFRAGNFGANDDTLRALTALGFLYDSSLNGAYIGQGCDISLDTSNMGLRRYLGICEVPVSGMMGENRVFRPAQLCAMSEQELRDALDHAASCGAMQFSAFGHSFEMLSRDRSTVVPLIAQRMEALFAGIAADDRISTGGFASLSLPPPIPAPIPPLEPKPLRSLRRHVEQGIGYLRHEAPIIRNVADAASNPPRWGKIAGSFLLAMA